MLETSCWSIRKRELINDSHLLITVGLATLIELKVKKKQNKQQCLVSLHLNYQ